MRDHNYDSSHRVIAAMILAITNKHYECFAILGALPLEHLHFGTTFLMKSHLKRYDAYPMLVTKNFSTGSGLRVYGLCGSDIMDSEWDNSREHPIWVADEWGEIQGSYTGVLPGKRP